MIMVESYEPELRVLDKVSDAIVAAKQKESEIASKKAEPNLEPMPMLYSTDAKTYMDYRCITNKNSPQWEFIYNSGEMEVCEDGFLRDKDGYIGVAMGSYFGDIGERYICHLDTGEQIPVVKIEAKANIHAVKGFCGYQSYDIIEFVIDAKAQWMQDNKWGNGYIFSGNFNNYEPFSGKIESIDHVIIE